MSLRSAVLLTAGLLAAAVMSAVPSAQAVRAAQDADPAPVRVLLLGDSVTQGSTGDWTWRYRLWRHLVGGGTAVDFVGPDSETWGYEGAAPAYADRAFDTDHAARWGRWAAEGLTMVAGLVEDYDPDVLVVSLGINDLLWGTSADLTVSLVQQLVANAQAADPDLGIVLSELTQEWLIGPFQTQPRAAEVNERLPALSAAASTGTSQVVVADAAAGFTQADTYDSSHPTAAGEVKIAAAVADALADLGVGEPYPRPLPAVPAVPAVAPTVSVASMSRGLQVSWSPVPGATAYLVSYRPVGSGAWTLVGQPAAGPVAVTGLENGRRYVVRVQGRKGTQAGAIREVAAAVRHPRPGAVDQVRARRAARSLTLSWRRAPGALSYRVEWRRPGRVVRAREVSGGRAVLRRLVPGRRYVVTIVPMAGDVAGPRTRAEYRTRRH